MPDNVFHLRREKILLDTSVYISHLIRGLHDEVVQNLIRNHVIYLHSVVFEEMLAGVRGAQEKHQLMQLKKPFVAANRIITPTDSDWQETGLVVNRLIGKGQMSPHKAVSLTHDCLIAVSAGRLGVRVVSENRHDFERIQAVKAFKLSVVTPD